MLYYHMHDYRLLEFYYLHIPLIVNTFVFSFYLLDFIVFAFTGFVMV